jgi:hypothetical protein
LQHLVTSIGGPEVCDRLPATDRRGARIAKQAAFLGPGSYQMNRRIVLAFSVSVVMSATIGYAGLSRAITDVRAPGFACTVTNGGNEGSFVNQGNQSTGSTLSLACPIPDVYNGVQGISTVQVAIFDRSTTASASASLCVSLFSTAGTS